MTMINDISGAVIALTRLGAVFRFIYCMVRLESAEEEREQYRKRTVNVILFYVLAESVWQIKELIFYYYAA